jgi:hypothetical protein
VPAADAAAGIVADWARQAGIAPRHAENLFRLFMAADRGDICGVTPKCGQCDVVFCKRLRYR